jgi:cyclic dehypoxanthinyl futalosine synthase
MVMRIINYTNVCVAQCDYCAFYVLPNQEGGYVLTREDVFAKIDELLELGGDLVGFNGGFNPKLPLHYYCDLFRAVRERYGDRVEFYALTIAEFMYLADRAKLSFADAALELRGRGVHWITGGGSEILTEDFRKRHAKFKYTVRGVLRGAAGRGGRRDAHHGHHGDRLRRDAGGAARAPGAHPRLPGRDRRGGLFSFLCWTYKPYGTALGGREMTPREYWRHIALSRIFLDNVKHFRTSVLTQNEDAFRALEYGADDFDLPVEDEVTQKAGATHRPGPGGLLEVPRAMGYRWSTGVRRGGNQAAPSSRLPPEAILSQVSAGGARFERVVLTRNRRIMASVTDGGRTLRLHESFREAPLEVLKAVGQLFSSRRSATRSAARAAIRSYLATVSPTGGERAAQRPSRPRASDRPHVDALLAEFREVNETFFSSSLPEVPIRISGRMSRRNGHFSSDPLEIAISRANG